MSSELSVTTEFILGRAEHAHLAGKTQTEFLRRLDNQATNNATSRLHHLSAALEEAIGDERWPWP